MEETSSVTGAPVVLTLVAVVVAAAPAEVVGPVAPEVVAEDVVGEHAEAATPKIAIPTAPVPTVRRNLLRSLS